MPTDPDTHPQQKNAEHVQQTCDDLRPSLGRVQELPDDDTWILDRRRTIGARFRAERERQDLTQEEVILAGRLDRVTIWRVETGQEVRLSTLLKIAHVLNVPLADLVG